MKQCDYGHDSKHIHGLYTSVQKEQRVLLCPEHWKAEMKWRKERNKTLEGNAKFPIRKWKTTKRKKK
jgi:hypothetical protein